MIRSVLFLAVVLPLVAATPVPVIFDTDIGNDIDDALALAMLHSLESLGESKLLAVTITKDCQWAAPYVDLVNHFYRRPAIPIGAVRNGKTPKDTPMIQAPAERKRPDGSYVYPRKVSNSAVVPEAVTVLMNALERAPGRSVVIIQVGFSTNLARLLDAPEGKRLVSQKVKLLSVMGGAFPDGKPEYNIKTDIPAAKKLFSEWPTPIVASGYEIGESILYPGRSIEKDYRYVADHPIAESYRAYMKMPYDRPTWDLTSVLYGVRPNSGYFSLSDPGQIVVDEKGKTRLDTARRGNHRYLTVNAEQRKRILAAMVELASRPPDR
ncbi:MAG: nucleoside hydrolase [Bryobacteraceae bacterium]